MQNTPSFIYGMSLSGISPDEVKIAEGFNKEANSPEAQETFHKKAALLASCLYKMAGEGGSGSQLVFSKIASEPWNPGYAALTDCVIDVLGREELEKRAFKPLDWLKGVAGFASNIPKTALIMAAALGAGGGALYNAGKRSLKHDTAKADAVETKIRRYRQLTREINNEMQRRGLSPEEAADSVMESYTT